PLTVWAPTWRHADPDARLGLGGQVQRADFPAHLAGGDHVAVIKQVAPGRVERDTPDIVLKIGDLSRLAAGKIVQEEVVMLSGAVRVEDNRLTVWAPPADVILVGAIVRDQLAGGFRRDIIEMDGRGPVGRVPVGWRAAAANACVDHPLLVGAPRAVPRSEEHTSELQSRENLVCRLLLE